MICMEPPEFCEDTCMVVRLPQEAICSMVISFKPIPRETITTMAAVPMITPRTVRTVRSFLRLKLFMLMIKRSGNLIFYILFFLCCPTFSADMADNKDNC